MSPPARRSFKDWWPGVWPWVGRHTTAPSPNTSCSPSTSRNLWPRSKSRGSKPLRRAASGSMPASHSRRCTTIVALGISALPPTWSKWKCELKIDLIVNSHFHFDHVGGNALIPNATMVVQRREWDAGMDPDAARRSGFDPRDFDLGHKLRLVDGEHDVFGDGAVVCLPTHGHTPGHQSLKLRLAGGDVVLAADSCYFCRTLRERRLPRFAHDREAMHTSLDRLAALETAGARIFFGHD